MKEVGKVRKKNEDKLLTLLKKKTRPLTVLCTKNSFLQRILTCTVVTECWQSRVAPVLGCTFLWPGYLELQYIDDHKKNKIKYCFKNFFFTKNRLKCFFVG